MRKYLLIPLLMLAGLLVPVATAGSADAATCARPKFTTTSTDGMWSNRGYVVHNNMWNVSGYSVYEKLSACSFHNWRAVARADNRRGDGAVKTYPNVHKDFHNWGTGHEPRLSSFRSIRSHWAARTPDAGIYNAAYDIWLNGIPNDEVMIWTYNRNQRPLGSPIARGVRLSGHRWTIWAANGNSYLAFVPQHRLTHGTLNIKQMLGWLVKHHRVSRNATLGQICYGFEVVSTGGERRTFKVNDFSISTRRR